MIFSLFGRKEGRSADRKRENAPDTGGRAAPTPAGAGRPSDQREIARLTAAKIDEIESQMIAGRAAPVARTPAQASVAGSVFVPSGAPRAVGAAAASRTAAAEPLRNDAASSAAGLDSPAAQAPLAPLDWTAEAGAAASGSAAAGSAAAGSAEGGSAEGGSAGVAIEVSASELLPLFEEAAVLFSNGQGTAAATVLTQAVNGDTLGAQSRHGWSMLFDICQAGGRREEFEALALSFCARFETSPPTWDPTLAPPAPDTRGQQSSAVVALPASLDAQAVRQLDQLQRNAQRNRTVTLDATTVRSVDPIGADLLLRALVAFRKAGRGLVLIGAEPLQGLVGSTIEPGRRDASDACWLLQLELLRALGRQQQFEDLSIDYCVTYEVSPPPWDPGPSTIRSAEAGAGEARASDPSAASFEATGHGLVLRGEIEGRAQTVFEALRECAGARDEVVVDCRGLRRLDFVAAGELLNELVALRAAGKYLVFDNVNHVVAALMVVMGIAGLADVRRRAV